MALPTWFVNHPYYNAYVPVLFHFYCREPSCSLFIGRSNVTNYQLDNLLAKCSQKTNNSLSCCPNGLSTAYRSFSICTARGNFMQKKNRQLRAYSVDVYSVNLPTIKGKGSGQSHYQHHLPQQQQHPFTFVR